MSSEDSLPYNGPLSTYAEWHALAHGLYHGLVDLRPVSGNLPDNPDVEKEPHYYKAGFVLSTSAQWGVLLVLVAILF